MSALLLSEISQHVCQYRLPGLHQHPALRFPHQSLPRQELETALRHWDQYCALAFGRGRVLPFHPNEEKLYGEQRLLQRPPHAKTQFEALGDHDGLCRVDRLRHPLGDHRNLLLLDHPIPEGQLSVQEGQRQE